jgi:hypothetical protein
VLREGMGERGRNDPNIVCMNEKIKINKLQKKSLGLIPLK